MNLPIIDTKAIAREQNKLKKKYENVLEQVNELPMSEDMRYEIQNLFLRAYHEETRDIVNKAMIGDIKEDVYYADEYKSEAVGSFVDPQPQAEPVNLGELNL